MVVRLSGTDGSCVYVDALGAGPSLSAQLVDGALVVAGILDDSGNVGCGPLPAGVYVSKRRPQDGTCLWSRGLGNINPDEQSGALGADAAGNVYFGTDLQGSLTFAGETLTTGPENLDALLLKFDPDGNEIWGKHWGDSSRPASAWISGIAVTSDQNVWFTGTYHDFLTLGSQTLGGPMAGSQLFFGGATADGELLYGASLSDPANGVQDVDFGPLLAAEPSSGSLILGTAFQGSLTVGGSTVAAAGASYGMLLAKLDVSNGVRPIWTKAFPNADPEALIVDSCGDIVAVGEYGGTMNLGCGTMTSKSQSDLFWARFGP